MPMITQRLVELVSWAVKCKGVSKRPSPKVLCKWILPLLPCVPEASPDSSEAHLGVRYTVGAQVLLEQGSILLASSDEAYSHLHIFPWAPLQPISEPVRVVDKKKNVPVCRIFASALHAVHITSKCTEARPWYPTPSLDIPPREAWGSIYLGSP